MPDYISTIIFLFCRQKAPLILFWLESVHDNISSCAYRQCALRATIMVTGNNCSAYLWHRLPQHWALIHLENKSSTTTKIARRPIEKSDVLKYPEISWVCKNLLERGVWLKTAPANIKMTWLTRWRIERRSIQASLDAESRQLWRSKAKL